jgi:hypothetical protein
VGHDFDTTSFLSAHDTPGPRMLDDLVERVVALDRDAALHQEVLGRPWFRGNRVPPCADTEAILDRFTEIFTTPIEPVARRRGPARTLGLDRLPDIAASARRRIVRRYRKITRTA